MILSTICSFDLNQKNKTELYLAIRLDIFQMSANPVIYAIHIWQICLYLDLNMSRLINVLKGLKKKTLKFKVTNQSARFTSSYSLLKLADIQ